MGVEIERKFLANASAIKDSAYSIKISQAYLSTMPNATVRVRLADDKAYLTIKSKTVGISRAEYEYEIPFSDAEEMMKLSESSAIIKTRYVILCEGHKWELDVFQGDNEGLVLAECELNAEDENIILPSWIVKEVSGDYRYNNSYLSKQPFKSW